MELILIAFLLLALGERREDLRAGGMKMLEDALARDERGKELLAAMDAAQRLAPMLRDPQGLTSLLEGGLLAGAGQLSSLFAARKAEGSPAKEEGDGLAPVAFADDMIKERLRAYFAQAEG